MRPLPPHNFWASGKRQKHTKKDIFSILEDYRDQATYIKKEQTTGKSWVLGREVGNKWGAE